MFIYKLKQDIFMVGPGMQLNLNLKQKPVQRKPKPEPKFLPDLIDECNYHARYPEVLNNVRSVKEKIRERKTNDLTNTEKAAVKTLIQLRHEKLDPFGSDLRWNPRYDRISKCRILFVKNREKLVD